MNTINNAIPFVPENTTDPAAGLNLSLNQIDALLQTRVHSVGANTPPAGVEGQRHIVGTAPTGAWVGQANRLARFLNAGWQFYDARMVMDINGLIYLRPGTTWTTGKQLSTEDYTSAEKAKLEALPSDTVTQAAAEAGVEAVPKLWTVQRVWQAIYAQWLSVTSVFGRELVASADAAAGRSALGLGTFATANYAAAPFVNLMPDSGRFAGKMNPMSRSAGAYQTSPFLSGYNGATSSSAGKFIHNNTTNGGSAGDLTQDVEDLLAAMGRLGASARYGIEFYVNQLTAGSGTLVGTVGIDGVSRNLLTTNGDRALFASDTYSTFVAWVRVKSGSAHIDVPYTKNSVSVPSGTLLAATWQPIAVRLSSILGYQSSFPRIYAAAGSEVQIAVPAFYPGVVDVGIHTAPLPNINELSA